MNPSQKAPGTGFGSAQPIGGGFGEAFDEQASQQAMTQAMSQKATSQQAAAPQAQALAQGQGGTAAANDFGSGGETPNEAAMQQLQKQMGGVGGAGMPGGAPAQKPPREVGTLAEELIERPIKDIGEGIRSIFSLNDLLNINPQTDTPEQQAKKKQIHQRYQQLTQEEQAEAQRQYQEEMERKQKEEQEAQEKKRREQEAAAQEIQAPSSPQKGPVGPSGNSGKQRAMTRLNTQRKNPIGSLSDNN